MNRLRMEQSLKLLQESLAASQKIRHEMKYHNAVIAEYARRGQDEELLKYLEEYGDEIEKDLPEAICANLAVNNILSAYTRRARREQIRVSLDVRVGRELAIPNLDLVAILANAYENAICACMEVKKQTKERECLIHLMVIEKNNKLVIYCSNTCKLGTGEAHGQPKPEFMGDIGVSNMIRTVESFGGEYEFKDDNGVFVLRLTMDIPPTKMSLLKV